MDLISPPHEHGQWQLVVDDETGCLLSTAHDFEGPQLALTALTLAADPAAHYGYDGPEPVDPAAQGNHELALYDAGRAPTVHLHPRGYFPNVVHAEGERVFVELDAEHPGLSISVAPIGQEPLDPGPFATRHHARSVGDHVWLMATHEPMSEADADRIAAGARWVEPETAEG